MQTAADFKFGVYEHYKGGIYTAFMLVRHHDSGHPMVVYCSHETGNVCVRPLLGWYPGNGNGPTSDSDGWLDEVTRAIVKDKVGRDIEYSGPRFRYLGEPKDFPFTMKMLAPV